MARNGKVPVTRLQKCTAAIEQLNQTEVLLKSINLRDVPQAMRPGIKTARANVIAARNGVAAAMRADVPSEVAMPLQRSA